MFTFGYESNDLPGQPKDVLTQFLERTRLAESAQLNRVVARAEKIGTHGKADQPRFTLPAPQEAVLHDLRASIDANQLSPETPITRGLHRQLHLELEEECVGRELDWLGVTSRS